MIDIQTILKDLYYCDFDIQEWINKRFQTPEKFVIHHKVVDHITTPEGLKFYPFECQVLYQVTQEYNFNDLTSKDIVLDLGANVGAFSIRAAQLCKHVYAVEPLYVKELMANIKLNNMENKITVISQGIGTGETIPISYQGRTKAVSTLSLKTLLAIIEPITFMKCDIEGAEWTINPEDISHIPRIEFEVHQGRDSCMPENLKLLEYIRKNWDTTTSKKPKQNPGCYIHAYPKKQQSF
jgi:FkbM family methyltransferase